MTSSAFQTLSASMMRSLKNQRVEYVPAEDCPHEGSFVLRDLPAGPHAPAKAEGKVLRRLMAQTGLTEAQLRAHKKYRIELSEAAKARGPKTSDDRFVLRFRKRIQRRLALPPYDPKVREAFFEEWARRHAGLWNRPTLDANAAWTLSLQFK